MMQKDGPMVKQTLCDFHVDSDISTVDMVFLRGSKRMQSYETHRWRTNVAGVMGAVGTSTPTFAHESVGFI